jgi:hypothetical protein
MSANVSDPMATIRIDDVDPPEFITMPAKQFREMLSCAYGIAKVNRLAARASDAIEEAMQEFLSGVLAASLTSGEK